MAEDFRVGVGYDIHRLVEGRRLILGGVEINHPLGLIGHTDADAVLHAVTDALLGASGLPDIGELFPDSDPAHQGADSRHLLSEAMKRVRARGFTPRNVDVIVHAERPKLSPYKAQMAETIAALTGLHTDEVCVKAKTNEGMGPVGHGEAIACTAIATIVRIVA